MSQDKTQILLMAVILIVAVNVVLNFIFLAQPLTRPAGKQTGVTRVDVLPTVCLTVNNPLGEVDFGSLSSGTIEDTLDLNPPPFNLENCGNVNVDIVLLAADGLWDPPNDVTSNFFQFQSADGEPGSVDIVGGGSIVSTFTNIPIATTPSTPVTLAQRLQFQSANDLLYGHIGITVPGEESSGAKSSTITFTASQSP